MTRDQMHNTLRYVREQLADERGSDFSGVEALDIVIAELEQEPKTEALDKIKEEILDLGGYREYRGLMPNEKLEQALAIIDKYLKGDTETWNGIHGQITAPKGTFEKIFNDTEKEDDDI